jgi:Flp pilus assembly pilin Flp
VPFDERTRRLGSGVSHRKEVKKMKLSQRLLAKEEGQGLVEYTLIVLLVALVFWVAIKNTNIGSQLANGWSKIADCIGNPTTCTSAS